MNFVILSGRVGVDPELKYTDTGTAVCRLRIATHRAWTDSAGARQERTDWHTVIVWNKLAEICAKYLSKGRRVNIIGSIQTRTYEDRDGVQRTITEIIANEVEFQDDAGPRNTEVKSKPTQNTAQKPILRSRPSAANVPFDDVVLPDTQSLFED